MEEAYQDVSELLQRADQEGSDLAQRRQMVNDAMRLNSHVFLAPATVAQFKKQAFKIYQKLAEAGDVDSMCHCASYTYTGWHDEKFAGRGMHSSTTARPDYAQAKEWCDKAIAAGSDWAKNTALPMIEEALRDEARKPAPASTTRPSAGPRR